MGVCDNTLLLPAFSPWLFTITWKISSVGYPNALLCVEGLKMGHHVTAVAQQDVSVLLMSSIHMNCRSKLNSLFSCCEQSVDFASDLYSVQLNVHHFVIKKGSHILNQSSVFWCHRLKIKRPRHEMVQSPIAIFTENHFHCTSRYKYATIKLLSIQLVFSNYITNMPEF